MRKERTHNTCLAKVAVQCSADTFVVNQSWFSVSNLVLKIATFAKPETVKGKLEPKLPNGYTIKKNKK